MEENYVLHELQEDNSHEMETSQESITDLPWHEPPMEATPEPTSEGHNLEFVPIEEPGSNWEMELAQAYVRAQPLIGVYLPEEGLLMGTAFPNLSKPYCRRG